MSVCIWEACCTSQPTWMWMCVAWHRCFIYCAVIKRKKEEKKRHKDGETDGEVKRRQINGEWPIFLNCAATDWIADVSLSSLIKRKRWCVRISRFVDGQQLSFNCLVGIPILSPWTSYQRFIRSTIVSLKREIWIPQISQATFSQRMTKSNHKESTLKSVEITWETCVCVTQPSTEPE